MAHLLASIQWDPEIRNILSLGVGIAVLIGSIYMLLATNLGARLGLMIALSGLFGWLAIMGAIWWMYGIGMKGEAAHWNVVEVNVGDIREAGTEQVRTLPQESDLPDPEEVLAEHPDLEALVIPEGQEGKIPTLGELIEADPSLIEELGLAPEDLDGWRILPQSDPKRGDAVASADAILGPDGKAFFEATTDYKVVDVFAFGGKEQKPAEACKPRIVNAVWDGCWARVKHRVLTVWHWQSPPTYAVVRVQPTIPPCENGQVTTPEHQCVTVEEGEPPPPPVADPTKPVYSVIMVRNLGDLRFPAAVVTAVFGFLFGLTCWRLHGREKLLIANRSAATT
jgi:hypothetical protein